MTVASMAYTETLTLYTSPNCPYCHKVEDFMKENNITSVQIKNVQDPKVRAELVEIGGKKQVPCLVYDHEALYESSDIIHWMKENILNDNQ